MDFCVSPLWDSQLFWLTSRPQLTECFRRTILTAIPPLLLLLLTPFDFRYFRPTQPQIAWKAKNISSAVLNVISIAISFSHLVSIVCHKVSTFSAIYEPLVDLTAFSMSLALFLIYKQNGRRISISLQLFWFLSTIVSIIRLYFWTKSVGISLQIVYSFYIFLSFVSFILSSICEKTSNRRRLLSEERSQRYETSDDHYCALEDCSAFSRITFFWLFRLLMKGLRQKIEEKDLNELCFTLKSQYISKQYNEFNKYFNSTSNQKAIRLLPVLCGLSYKSMLFAASLLLIYLPALYTQPFILNKILDFLANPLEYEWHGLVYALGYCLTGLVASFSLQSIEVLMYNTAIRCKSGLTIAIYKKVFRLSPSARKEYTSGEVVNLIAVDCQEIFFFVLFSHYLLIVPISLVVGFYFLWQYLGIASIGSVVVIALLAPITILISRTLDRLQKRQMDFKDKRMAKISEIINSIKAIKLNAWELPFLEMVAKLRDSELKALKILSLLFPIIDVVWIMAPMIVAGVCFGIYAYKDYANFNSTTIFVSLALIYILRIPMGFIPVVVSSLIRAVVSYKRLSKFLSAEELEEYCIEGNHSGDHKHSISIESATFTYGLEEPPVLKDISLNVTKGSLVAVIGEVGAGKSSLLSALIGNIYKTEGRVEVNGSIAYVPQTAWIQNKTLRDNIIFMAEEDETRYNQVLSACALLPDLKVLPAGDRTEIGEKGINLSGGQKQRVSLCRAVYQDSDIYLLDDPLSAVDAHVGKQLFDDVIGPNGILQSKTRILCSHNLSFLQNCDQICVLKSGHIVGFGSYDEISALGLLSDIGKGFEAETDKGMVDNDRNTNTNVDKNCDNLSLNTVDIGSGDLKPRTSSVSSMANIIEEEFIQSGSVRWSDYGQYVVSTGIVGFIAFAVFRIGFNGSEVSANYWLSLWSNRNSSQNIGLSEGLLVYGSFIGSEAIFILLGDIIIFLCGIRASKIIHKKALYGIIRSPLSFFDKTPTGRVLNRFSKDISKTDEMIPYEIAGVFEKMTWFPILYILVALTFKYLALALLAVIALFYALYKFYLMTSRQTRRLESINNSPVQSHFCESIAGAHSIRAFNVLPQFISETNKRLDLSQNCSFHTNSLNIWLRLWANIIGALITLMIAVYIVLNRQHITIGLAGLLLNYAVEAVSWMSFTIRCAAQLETDMISIERLREFSELSAESDWDSDPNSKPPEDWPQKGCIEFRDYSTTYRTGLKPVLKDINFFIKSGERVGVCGRTGAGKSSLALSLFRIIEALEGQILIDGIDIRTIGLHDLRRRISIIPQDPILFADTLRMNLDPLNDYNDDQLWTALENSNLSQFVRQLAEGLDHKLTEGGDNLSGGQKQLVCLARALLRGSKILVLDEAMSACDIETDRLIQQTIRQQLKDCSLLTIAHRLNTIIDYDRILVLQFGRIVENDSPNSLLRNENSIFHSLAKEAKII